MPTGSKNKVIPGCGTHHISIQTFDWDESMRFYRDVLGMAVAAQFGSPDRPMALLDMGDGSHIELVGLTKEPTVEAGSEAERRSYNKPPILHLALATTDTPIAVERVRRAGYEITTEPRTIDLSGMTVTIAFFKGPNGEEIEFFQTH